MIADRATTKEPFDPTRAMALLRVAVKALPPGLGSDPAQRERRVGIPLRSSYRSRTNRDSITQQLKAVRSGTCCLNRCISRSQGHGSTQRDLLSTHEPSAMVGHRKRQQTMHCDMNWHHGNSCMPRSAVIGPSTNQTCPRGSQIIQGSHRCRLLIGDATDDARASPTNVR